jgi:hypothetical protein
MHMFISYWPDRIWQCIYVGDFHTRSFYLLEFLTRCIYGSVYMRVAFSHSRVHVVFYELTCNAVAKLKRGFACWPTMTPWARKSKQQEGRPKLICCGCLPPQRSLQITALTSYTLKLFMIYILDIWLRFLLNDFIYTKPDVVITNWSVASRRVASHSHHSWDARVAINE